MDKSAFCSFRHKEASEFEKVEDLLLGTGVFDEPELLIGFVQEDDDRWLSRLFLSGKRSVCVAITRMGDRDYLLHLMSDKWFRCRSGRAADLQDAKASFDRAFRTLGIVVSPWSATPP